MFWVSTSGTDGFRCTGSTSWGTHLTSDFTRIIISGWTFTRWGVNSDIVTGDTRVSVVTSGTVIGTIDTGVSVIERTIWASTFWGSSSWWSTISTVISGVGTGQTLVVTRGTSVVVVVTVISFILRTFWAS